MSPEQCRGLNDEVDGATDIYALGCILFEMLCGRAPYVSPGWGDVLMMHMSDEIPVPSTDNPRVPPALDKVVRTALAKKKTDRFASMRDMHRALAQSRNDVQDTPAPLMKTDPQMPAILLGVDELGRPSGAAPVRAAGATPAPAANEHSPARRCAIQPRLRTRRSWSGQRSRRGRRGPRDRSAAPGTGFRVRPRGGASARGCRAAGCAATDARGGGARDRAGRPDSDRCRRQRRRADDGRREDERRRQGDDGEGVEVASPSSSAKRSRQVVTFRAA